MKAYFAGGCFWCVTPIFKIYGVDKVVSGYSGGKEKNPSYEDVKSQKTGHRETIMLEYDPDLLYFRRGEKACRRAHTTAEKRIGEGRFRRAGALHRVL